MRASSCFFVTVPTLAASATPTRLGLVLPVMTTVSSVCSPPAHAAGIRLAQLLQGGREVGEALVDAAGRGEKFMQRAGVRRLRTDHQRGEHSYY